MNNQELKKALEAITGHPISWYARKDDACHFEVQVMAGDDYYFAYSYSEWAQSKAQAVNQVLKNKLESLQEGA